MPPVTFAGEQIFPHGPDGEKAILHVSAGTEAPTTDVKLLEGWSIERKTLDEPRPSTCSAAKASATTTSFATSSSSPTTRSRTRGTYPDDGGPGLLEMPSVDGASALDAKPHRQLTLFHQPAIAIGILRGRGIVDASPRRSSTPAQARSPW